MHTFQLSYDYRCPFAKNIHLHVITALLRGPTSRSPSYRGR